MKHDVSSLISTFLIEKKKTKIGINYYKNIKNCVVAWTQTLTVASVLQV